MRDERLYLDDIVEAADATARFLVGVSREEFLASDLLQSAVLQKLTIIGEAASRLSRPLRDRSPEIPWSRIVAFRNFAVHVYFAVDWTIVWTAATREAAALRAQVARLLDDEGGS